MSTKETVAVYTGNAVGTVIGATIRLFIRRSIIRKMTKK